MVPFNKEQQRSFVERTYTLASEKGWKHLFGASKRLEEKAAPDVDHVGFSFARTPVCA